MMIIPEEISFRQKLYEHIKLREGYKNVVYLDTLGKPTGGIGHLLSKEECEKYKVDDVLKAVSYTHLTLPTKRIV